ncbi:MAG: wax ester/triacylglycerol synthase family O-acyltransferase [Halioglobus sp.]
MHQLGALDNLMIAGEMPNIPLHMSALMIYDTRGKRGARRIYDALFSRLEDVADNHFPILRCRLDEVPLNLDKAYWVRDTRFELGYHIKRIALPRPANWQELYQLFGQFHAQPLDRQRPLWELMLVEGLDNVKGVRGGGTALCMKIHHSVVDGKSALRLIRGLHSPDPEPEAATFIEREPPQPADDREFAPPSLLAKLGLAWWHGVERPVELVATLGKLLPGLWPGQDSRVAPTAPGGVPRVAFNHPVDADRVVGHVRMHQPTLKKVARKFHCTINDIALCVVAGALREHLMAQDSLPERDLLALMPIDIRREREDGSIGNQVSVAKVSLFTHMDDVAERLQAISEHASAGKAGSREGSSRAMLELVDEIHPAIILGLGDWLVSSGHIDDLPQTVNTVVTNVPGPQGDAYLAGAKLVDYLGFGPLAPNIGLFHTVSSAQEHVNISFLSTAAFMADGKAYRKALENALRSVLALGTARGKRGDKGSN